MLAGEALDKSEYRDRNDIAVRDGF